MSAECVSAHHMAPAAPAARFIAGTIKISASARFIVCECNAIDITLLCVLVSARAHAHFIVCTCRITLQMHARGPCGAVYHAHK